LTTLFFVVRKEIEPKSPCAASTVLAASKTNAAEFMVNETTLRTAAGRKEKREREREKSRATGGSGQEHGGMGANYFVS
jgi:hypothetical protein